MSFSFDLIDFSSYINDNNNNNNNGYIKDIESHNKVNKIYDKITNETYRIKRLYKIDPMTDIEVPSLQCFEFKYKWNPYDGTREEIDEIGPLCFNAIDLYDYFYINRYRGLWTPPQDGYEGMYGDMVGSGRIINSKSRGTFPEKYLFRLPIIDCYLPESHNLSIITMGPELTEDEITQIDTIVKKYHPKKSNTKFASLTMLKYYYDRALEKSPNTNSDEIKELKIKYPNLTEQEINAKYNRHYVDKLVGLKY